MRYIIWSPPYDPTSGGIKVLHKLCHEMRSLGYDAYLTVASSSGWNTPCFQGNIGDDCVAIYPEIVFGNPIGCKKVIRWVLNKPGKIGGPTEYDKTDYIYAFHKMFYPVDNDHVLLLPVIETDIFKDKHLDRGQAVCYIGKGGNTPRIPETIGLLEITRGTALNPENLCNILNQSSVMYCYDNITAMTEIARLCGCPVCIIPDGEHTKEERDTHEFGWNGLSWGTEIPKIDSNKFRETYLHSYDVFKKTIHKLVKETS